MAKKKYNFIDLFCGAGGFAKGFEMTNKFQCIGGIDNKQSAIETHKLNFKKSVIWIHNLLKNLLLIALLIMEISMKLKNGAV